MTKFKKLIVVTVCLVILIFPFNYITVSAESADCEITGNTNIGGFDLYYAGVELIKPDNTNYSGGVVYCNPLSSTKTRVQINSFGNGSYSLEHGSTVGVTLFFDPLNTDFKNKNLSCTGSFTLGFRKDMCEVTSFYINRTGSSSSGGLAIQYPKITDITKSDENFIYYRVTFDEKTFDCVYDQYIIHIVYDVKAFGDSYAKYLYLFDFDFQAVDKETYQLNAIDNSIGKHTDKIMEGDEDIDSKAEANKVDGAMGDIGGATDSAMGGKTDEQVQEEIQSALNPDEIGLDFNKAQRISKLFDDCLNAFGVSYKTLLLLSLALGLASFLIGRRYN